MDTSRFSQGKGFGRKRGSSYPADTSDREEAEGIRRRQKLTGVGENRRAALSQAQALDVRVSADPSMVLFFGETENGRNWLATNLPDDCPMLGKAYAVERNYAGAIIEGMREDGLTVA